MDAREVLHKALIELCEEVEQILTYRIKLYGANRRGKNTLIDSDLEKSIKVSPTEDGIALSIADYWEFVSRGWERTHNSKYSGTFTKYLMNIRDWIRKKGIQWGDMTENQMMWALAKTMFNEKNHYTIPPRPFMVYDEGGDMEKMIPELKEYMDEWFDKLFNEITKELDNFFK